MQTHPVSHEQQEIIALLLSELAEFQSTLAAAPKTPQSFVEHARQLEHLSNALEMAGLQGLAFCARHLAAVYNQHSNSELASPRMPHHWVQLFIAYLIAMAEGRSDDESSASILHFFSNPDYAFLFDAETLAGAAKLFNCSQLTQDEPDTLPETLTEDMLSLNVDKDVRADLLQGMLSELPEQTRLFEQSVNDFLRSGNFAELQQAQRIAHTIKGAANVVALPGMANLTHYAEDLLEQSAKTLHQVPDGFNDLLVQISDCLSACADFLAQQGPHPADLAPVMAELLRWLKHIKFGAQEVNELSPHEIAEPAAEYHVATPAAEQDQPKTNPEEGTTLDELVALKNQRPQPDSHERDELRFIQLPDNTAQDLLRLSGEIHIANNQIISQAQSLENTLEQARNYHKQIKQMAEELEQLIHTHSAANAVSMQYSADEFDPLEMERFSELHTFSNRLLELVTDSHETLNAADQQVKDLSNLAYSQKRINKDSQDKLININLVPVHSISARFSRCVRQTCRITGKAARLEIIGEEILIDSRVLHKIADPIMHLLRNAIDHGLEESSEARIQAGKPAEGCITLSFTNRGDAIEITCQDDGRGLDYERIEKMAIIRGLLDGTTQAKKSLLNQIILLHGFSTRERVSQTSGRGVGLDTVVASVKALKGNVSVDSAEGRGSVFSLRVPTSLLSAHALLASCRDQDQTRIYGIASRAIKRIIYASKQDLIELDRRPHYPLRDGEQVKNIPVQSLAELLNVYSVEDEEISALLLTERLDGSPVAIAVEKIIASQDLVIKPLNKYACPVPGVIGVTLLGDGSISPVIDLNDLPNMFLSPEERDLLHTQRLRRIVAERASHVQTPSALVVDDSLSARRSLAQFVADIGMDVYTAKDGFDAIALMREKKPTLMLVDLEMPRMNGLELTEHIRSQAEFKDIPVIMLTSRSTKKHRDLAKRAGVNVYLTKPWSEDELISCIKEEMA